MSKEIYYQKDGIEINLDLGSLKFDTNIEPSQALKYLKFFFNTKEKFVKNFIGPLKKAKKAIDPDNVAFESAVKDWDKNYENINLFTFKEAFECTDEQFKAKIFGTINIPEMVKNLGSKIIAKATKDLSNKKFNQDGSPAETKNYQVVYETYKVNGGQLGISDNLYVVRCWCDSTGEEHFIWIESQYADNPLEAIASTFRVPSGVIPYIKEIKRQGDILLCEMDESFADAKIDPKDSMVALSAEQYFNLLTAQS